MPVCPHCNAELGWFIVVCPFCGTNVQLSKQDEKEDESITGIGFLQVRVAVALVVAVVALVLKVDRFIVLLLIPTTVVVGLAGQAAWDRIKHRKEPRDFR